MKITLCGSTRYHREFEAANLALSLAGHVVYTVACAEQRPGKNEDEPSTVSLTARDKEVLDLVHLKKIADSDAVVLVSAGPDKEPYVGDSTRREVTWAAMLQKPVYRSAENFLTLSADYHSPRRPTVTFREPYSSYHTYFKLELG